MIALWESFRQSDRFPQFGIRDAAGCGLGVLGFGSLCLFHAAATNLFLFAYGIFALLLALVIIGPSRITAELMSTPREFAFALAWFVALVVSYAFSLSKDGSFVPTLVLAVPAIGFVLGRILAEHARVLFGLVSLVVLGFACWSTVNLLLRNDLAHFAMTDVNNYGTLLYLIAIPWIHTYLVGRWRGGRYSPSYHALSAIGMFVMFVALLGTSSRVCFLVVGIAFAVWCGLTLWRRLNLWPLLMCASVAAVAYMMSSLAVDVSAVDRFTELGVSTGIRVRGALIGSAIQMLDRNLLIGVGVFVFPLLYRTHRTLDDLGTTGLFVHNDYLQFLVEGGLPLFALAVVFLIVVIRRCLRSVSCEVGNPGFTVLGLHLAVCAAAFHALANFVYYTPALGFVIGLMVALGSGSSEKSRGETTGETSSGQGATSRLGLSLVVAGLVFGWSCFGYLAVDTMSAGVFGGQPGVPFASAYRRDPDRMLSFAVAAQRINKNRGLPVLVEASLLERKAAAAGDPDKLVERSLAAYQRAVEIDRWNGSAWLGMARFLDSHPQLQERLVDQSSPESLVLASLEIDPLFVPGIDWLMMRYLQSDRPQAAYELVRRQVLPWLKFLGRENPDAAVNYFRFLEANAKQLQDTEVIAALERLRSGAG